MGSKSSKGKSASNSGAFRFRSGRSASASNIWEKDLRRTLSILGPPQSGVSTVSTYVNDALKRKDLPFDAIVDSVDVFYEEHEYFGRMGGSIRRVDKRAEAMAKLGALVFLVDASDILSAFRFPWKQNQNRIPEFKAAGTNSEPLPLTMKEDTDWLPQMVNMQMQVLVNKPVLILVNKCDVPNSVTAEQVRDRLLAKRVPGMNIRIQECVANGGVGLQQGFEWLKEQVNKSLKAKTFFGKNAALTDSIVLGKLSDLVSSSNSEPPLVLKVKKMDGVSFNSFLTSAAKALV